MKKVSLVSLASIVLLTISSICAYFLKHLDFKENWEPLFIGFSMLIISVILAFAAKRFYKLNFFCFIFNGIALGFCIRSWYLFRGFENNLGILILVALLSSLYIFIYYLYSLIPIFDKHPNVMTLLFFSISLVGYILVVIYTKTTFVSTLGYYMIIELAFIFSMCAEAQTYKKFFRNTVLSTYSVLVVAIIVAIIIGSESLDIDDLGLDFNFSNFKKQTKKDNEMNINIVEIE